MKKFLLFFLTFLFFTTVSAEIHTVNFSPDDLQFQQLGKYHIVHMANSVYNKSFCQMLCMNV